MNFSLQGVACFYLWRELHKLKPGVLQASTGVLALFWKKYCTAIMFQMSSFTSPTCLFNLFTILKTKKRIIFQEYWDWLSRTKHFFFFLVRIPHRRIHVWPFIINGNHTVFVSFDCRFVWNAGVTSDHLGLVSHPPITPGLGADRPITHQLCTQGDGRGGGGAVKEDADERETERRWTEQFWQEWHVAHFLLTVEYL